MQVAESLQRLHQTVCSRVIGKEQVVQQCIVCLLCRGHLLIEDVPGVAKTLLAKTLSTALRARFRRVQFTPDLMPSDVTGTAVYNQRTGDFEFKPGPVFTNVLLADEINRASPRTQSSLLECMEERQVTQEGTTHALQAPFFVIATQNPVEMQGTYPLPEAQLDRFFMKLSVGYLSLDNEVEIMRPDAQPGHSDDVPAVLTVQELDQLQQAVDQVHVNESLLRYMACVIRRTRDHEHVDLGASPRGSLALRRASQAQALVAGRDYVTPDHIKAMIHPVLRHRIMLKPQSKLTGVSADEVLTEVVNNVDVPVG